MDTFNLTECNLNISQVEFRPPIPCAANYTEECQLEWSCEVLHYYQDDLANMRNVAALLLRYGTFTIIILGILLNCLSFFVLHSSGLSKNGSGIYLVALAICDSGNLILNFAAGVARSAFPGFNDIFMQNDWLCRFHSVFIELFQLTTAWIVVAFTVERCLMIWKPMAIMKNKVKRSRIILLTILLTCTSLALTKLFLQGFEKDSVFGYVPCTTNANHWQGVGYFRIALQTWFPTCAVFVFNILIFYKLEKVKRNRANLTGFQQASNKSSHGSDKISSFARPSRTTPMLIAVSLAYLVLVFPLGVVQTFEFYWSTQVPPLSQATINPYNQWKKTKLLLKYIRCMCFCFYQLNFGINFFLYFVTGVQFRIHLLSKLNQLKHFIHPVWLLDRTKSSGTSASARTMITPFNSTTSR